MNYRELASELRGVIPDLSFPLAQRYVNRAWRWARDSYPWSFLHAEGTLEAPDAISAGTITVTQFQLTVVGDASAQAVWDAFGMNPPITTCQLRAPDGRIYNISTYDSAGTLTLERVYEGEDAAAQTYTIYRSIFLPPGAPDADGLIDFLRFKAVVDPANITTLIRSRQRAWLDYIDPTRSFWGSTPSWVVSSEPDAYGNPRFELYPAPTARNAYICFYQKRGSDLVAATDRLPAQIPDDLIVQRALYLAAQFASANQGRFPSLKGTRLMDVMKSARAECEVLLAQAKRQDDNLFFQSILIPNRARFGVSADWLQSHAPPYGYLSGSW